MTRKLHFPPIQQTITFSEKVKGSGRRRSRSTLPRPFLRHSKPFTRTLNGYLTAPLPANQRVCILNEIRTCGVVTIADKSLIAHFLCNIRVLLECIAKATWNVVSSALISSLKQKFTFTDRSLLLFTRKKTFLSHICLCSR